MREGKGVAKRFLSGSELSYVRYGLRLDAAPDVQKRTLQTLCEYYEANRLIADASDVRQMIHSHLGSGNVLVRRWAIKALALIGHFDDFQRIVERLRVENDEEAQTWGVTALVKHARGRGIDEICKMAGLTANSAINLAARLYAPRKWLENNAPLVRISLHADELTLKWATFLIGYGQAPVNLFDPKYPNEVFLGELNAHDAPDISEYSIWALWERKEFGAGFSKIPLLDAYKSPDSVRRWVYRLATKSPAAAGLDADALADLRSSDDSYRARDGLALGVADLDPTIFASKILEWYTCESNPQVRESLLASMATKSAENVDYADAVEQRFKIEQADSTVRRRLLAASEGTKLYGDLMRLHIESRSTLEGLNLFDAPHTVIMGNFNNMVGPNVTIGGNVNAQNIAFGDMINSAHSAVQHLKNSDQITAAVLDRVLMALRDTEIEPERAEVVAAVKEVASAPSAKSKITLFEKLTDYGRKAACLGNALCGFDKLIQSVQQIPF
jgi:hypothetical protein